MRTSRRLRDFPTSLCFVSLSLLLAIGSVAACDSGPTSSSSASSVVSVSVQPSPEQTSPPASDTSLLEMLPAEGSYALVYDGPVAAEGAAEAVAAVVEETGLPVTYISDISELPELLEDASVFIVGGTEDDLAPLYAAFTPEIDTAFKDYLHDGGRYLGICGGGYLASTGWDEYGTWVPMLGIVPAESGVIGEDEEPRILSVDWLGETYPMYYQYGPTFILMPTSEDVQTIAHYNDGHIAALLCTYGQGKVAVSGPHPEAEEDWAWEATDGDDWISTSALLVDLLEKLLSGDPVNP